MLSVYAASLMPSDRFLLAFCATLYVALTVMIVRRSRRRAPLLLAGCCLITAGWAALAALPGGVVQAGIGTGTDLVRASAWFWLIFFLYHDARIARPAYEWGFAAAGVTAAGLGAIALLNDPSSPLAESVFSLVVLARLGLAIVELLLIENLYLNLPDHARWHVAVPSVMLGGLACYDMVLCADLALFHQASPGLLAGRTLAMIMITPLLLVAAGRGQRWKGRVRLSRDAVFHSATLVLSGGVLIAVAAAGEAFRRLGGSWGWLAQTSLVFATIMAVGLLLTSASARSRFQNLFMDHFFAERYDYRRQWLKCIATLSGDDGDVRSALPTRAVRAIASVVDSPAGALFLREGPSGSFSWAGSWNLPRIEAVPGDHAVVDAVQGGEWIARFDEEPGSGIAETAPLQGLGPLWLAVPLLHQQALTGLVLIAPPRAPFMLELEVFKLLRIVAQEVSTYLAEQRATQTLLQTRQLHDYSKRFAFVAHDIKNVSSQLGLVLSNAQHHIANPEFQKDMLETVGASVRKITALLERLERPEIDRAPAALTPAPRIEALVATYRRVRNVPLAFEHDGSTGTVAMAADAFEMAVTHVLNNAIEAAGRKPVLVRVRHEVLRVVVEIVDEGCGMTAEFMRDQLFQPFSTSKVAGSGIGAFQSRELVREAGGEMEVSSAPGVGTTVRLLLPRTDAPVPAATQLTEAAL